MIEELEQKYEGRAKIQMVDNERRFSAVENTMDELEKKYEEKVEIERVKNETKKRWSLKFKKKKIQMN